MSGKKKVMMAAVATVAGSYGVNAYAQVISYTTPGANYTQNFDTLASSTGTAIGTFTWNDGTTLNGWYAFKTLPAPGGPPTDYRAVDGSSNSGQIYSFGTGGSTDRAIGTVGSGTPSTMYFGMKVTNDTGITLGGFTMNYTGEEWRATGTAGSAAGVNTLGFSYSTTASSIGATSGYTPATALDFRAPDAGSPPGYTGADSAVNGNDPTFQRAIGGNVTITGGWAPGTTLWLRWTDLNDGGNDQGLGIDNLTFSAVAHIPQHNNTSLNVAGSKAPTPPINLGRVVAGQTTNGAVVTLSNTQVTGTPVSTTYADISADGSTVTPATGSVPANGSTPITVKIGGAGTTADPGTDVARQAIVQNTGKITMRTS